MTIRQQINEIKKQIETLTLKKGRQVIICDHRDLLDLYELLKQLVDEDEETALRARTKIVYLIDENFDYKSLADDRTKAIDKLARGLLKLMDFQKTLKGLPRVGAMERVDEFYGSGMPQIVSKALQKTTAPEL